jgi:hypothetical protein
MPLGQLEALISHVGKAPPPPVLHRYRRASRWAIKELSVPELHIAGVVDMNDPFEYRAPIAVELDQLRAGMYTFCQGSGMDHAQASAEAAALDASNAEFLRQLISDRTRASSGLICMSSDPRSNRMWAYYGDGHKGICIGYCTEFSPFCFAREVAYSDPDAPIDVLGGLNHDDPTILSNLISCRKGAEWAFEQEYRVQVGPIPPDAPRLLPIHPEAIVEIRFGVNISPEFRADVIAVATKLPRKPRLLQMGCSPEAFVLTETEVKD